MTEEFLELTEPLRNYLKEFHNPYTKIEITTDDVKLTEVQKCIDFKTDKEV